jgi:hypothetical protein
VTNNSSAIARVVSRLGQRLQAARASPRQPENAQIADHPGIGEPLPEHRRLELALHQRPCLLLPRPLLRS